MPNNLHTLNKPYRMVLDYTEMPDTCWNCKTHEVQVDTTFGPVCFGCEVILNALPTMDVAIDSEDVVSVTVDGMVWDVRTVKPKHNPRVGLSMTYEYGGQAGATLSWFGPRDWHYNATDSYGDGEGSRAYYDGSPTTLATIMEAALETMTELVESENEGDSYVDGWDDTPMVSDYESDLYDVSYL